MAGTNKKVFLVEIENAADIRLPKHEILKRFLGSGEWVSLNRIVGIAIKDMSEKGVNE